MDENTKTEQDISDALLQQITGGCGDCEKDSKAAARYKMISNGNKNLARIAYETNMPKHIVEDHIRVGLDTQSMAQFFEDRVKARQGTPGHDPAPGESSSSEPPNKRQRII